VPKFVSSEILSLAERLLSAGSLPASDAALVARLLVKAELRGYPGHGLTRVAQYLAFVKSGTVRLDSKPVIIREGKTTAVIDGRHYIGQVVAHQAMELAIKKAKEHGAGIVCIRRASHTGRLADYMEMAADAGMIGIGAVSVGAGTTTLYGGMERIGGTNPIAFGFPGRNGAHVLIDLATASMSMGEIQKRVARKEKLPEGMMLDASGNPTTDFKKFRGPPRGVFLPFGGHKGSGIALATEFLGGILSGNGASKDWWQKGGHGVNGVFLQAVAVEEFQPLDEFLDKVEEFVRFVKSTKPAPGFSEILLPGEHGRANEERQIKEGLLVDDATWSELQELAAELGVNLPDQRK
jgi:uncharacterized oxidoreductase